MVATPLRMSMIGRGCERGLLDVRVHNLRSWAEGRHAVADDTPYGGGAGMVMKVDVAARAVAAMRSEDPPPRVILTSPAGRRFDQVRAHELRIYDRLVILCGHYEGIDDRIRTFVDEEISLGDYVLTGGELAAMVIVDAVGRLVPGVVGNEASLPEESFETGLLDYPHFTRPRVYEGMEVPPVLLSGNHREIARWRRGQALRRTERDRPDLLRQVKLSVIDQKLLAEVKTQPEMWLRPSEVQTNSGCVSPVRREIHDDDGEDRAGGVNPAHPDLQPGGYHSGDGEHQGR